MVSLNADNITQRNKSQDESNFLVVKELLRHVWKLNITLSAMRVLLYQINQEFGFIKDGRLKDGDKVTHKLRSRHLNINKRTEIDATQELERLNILIIERKHRVINHYHINRDTSTWLLSSDIADTSDTTEYTFTPYQLKEINKHCDDLETEVLWLKSIGIPQDKAFATLMRKLSHAA